MAKDRSGKFHPVKGKPSGAGKEEGLGLRESITPEELEQDLKMTDKYTKGPDKLEESVHMLHPNRNTSKKEEQRKLVSEQQEGAGNKSMQQTFTQHATDVQIEEISTPVSKERLQQLSAFEAPVCISIYIPTHQSNWEATERYDVIAFKNHLQDAMKTLREQGLDELELERILEPGFEVLRDDSFWKELDGGLAFFIADGFFSYIKLPATVEEKMTIGHRFLLSPLLLFQERLVRHFFILVISKKQAKLFRADQWQITAIEVPELPRGVEDVIHFEEKDDQQLFRTGGRGGTGGANFHGIGSGKPDEKENLAIYFHEVDETLRKEVLNTETAPLLLAGIDYMMALYSQTAKYKHVWPETLNGSHEFENVTEMYKQAMPIMKAYFEEPKITALERFGNKSGTSLTSTDVTEIIPAAFYGRVDTLFVQQGASIHGTFDEANNQLQLADNTNDKAQEDLLDKVVMQTALKEGDVIILDKNEMPEQATLAAIMRY